MNRLRSACKKTAYIKCIKVRIGRPVGFKERMDILGMFPEHTTSFIVDNIILYLFKTKKTKNKKAFWELFESCVYENLVENLETQIAYCEHCGKRFRKNSNATKYCPNCRGYQPIQFKTLTCVDCGQEFVVAGNNKRTRRCEECQKQTNKENTRNRVIKYRMNKM